MPLRWTLRLAALLSLLALPTGALAQVKPYFLVIFDTSGSMNDEIRSLNCATTSCTCTSMESCNFTTSNSCGFSTSFPSAGSIPAHLGQTKLDAAKCALANLVNATGEADFGLMQFAQAWGGGCAGAGSSGSNTCSPEATSALLRVPIRTNTAPSITALVDKQGTAGTEELCGADYTPLGGTLVAAKAYFEGTFEDRLSGGSAYAAPTATDTALACRPLSVILLTDGVECCNACDNSQALWNAGCPMVEGELVASGLDACTSGSGACVNAAFCTAGDAFETAPEKAYLLRDQSTVPSASGAVSKTIRTYLVGLGIDPDSTAANIVDARDRLERIAVGGGTDNPSSATLRAFYAQDEAELSIAFSQIIADAQPSAETCDGMDDDCDGLVDEGIPKFCNRPLGIDDLTLCDEPDETNCDGIDDDCDGIIDEGVVNECGFCGGDAPTETCDNFDNDCDGNIDEDITGGACGEDEGECRAGELTCIAGQLQCENERRPQPEECNCKDDDCDGKIDEDVTGDLCEGGRCVACQCNPFCEPTEFGPSCEADTRPETQPSGECLCVVDACDGRECEQMSIDLGDGVLCAPESEDVAECTCRAGACTFVCDGVTCGGEQTCNPRTGQCVVSDCRGLGCASGQVCDPTSGECTVDPCVAADCNDLQVCRGGECETSCAGLTCEEGKSCQGGRCVDDPCAAIDCASGFACDAERAACVENLCVSRPVCEESFTCVPTTGECEPEPCWNVQCPSGQRCAAGECELLPDQPRPVIPGRDPFNRLLASGGGGCACSTLGAPQSGTHRDAGVWLAGGFGVLLAWRTRSRRRGARAVRSGRSRALTGAAIGALLIALASVLGGCSVNPYCLDCGATGAGSGGAGGSSGVGGVSGGGGTFGGAGGAGGTGGSSGASGASGTGGVGGGGGMPDGGCGDDPPAEECNGMDDDCDLRVDEEVFAEVNDCNQQGVCANTDKVCVAGDFECVYPSEREDDETRCDGLDEDCDGRVDETFTTLGDECTLGVGACATTGELECNGAGSGVVCVIGAMPDPSDELCDGIDNDCDGLADEPKSNPGSAASYVHDDVVQVAASLWIYRYEASRADATSGDGGRIGERACSRDGVRPWTSVTYDEAVAACEAADMVLCGEAAWINACNGPSNNCVWGYTPSGGSCLTAGGTPPNSAYPTNGTACNGHDLTATQGSPDTDAIAATGSFANCFVPGLTAADTIFDLSGNAKEWVTDDANIADDLPAGSNPLRGGSYNNLPGGMRCDFAFSAADNDVRLGNVGFRCCSSSAP